MTLTGQYFGTPRYMAPEQAGGGGAVGHRPVLKATAIDPALPAALDRVLARELAKRPADRFASGA